MTTPKPIEEACEVFEQKLDAFEKLMKLSTSVFAFNLNRL